MKNEMHDTEKTRPGMVYISSIDKWVAVTWWQMKSYYYGVPIPQDVKVNATTALFGGHIGDKEWTNFTRPNMIPKWHRSLVYKVSLAVKPTAEVKVVDIFRALQLGELTINVRHQEPFISEPLSFFPVTIYGEMAARENDLAAQVSLPTTETGELDEQASKAAMRALSKMAIPIDLDDSVIIDGEIDLRKELYGTPPFVLYVILHTVTKIPLRDSED